MDRLRPILSSLAVLVGAQATAAQELDVHEFVRERVVYLVAQGETANGVPMRTEGTGFFVNEAGNILTTYHLLTKLGDVKPDSIKIEARIRSKNALALTASPIDAKPNRDLLLLDVADGDAGKPLCANTGFDPSRLKLDIYSTGFSSVLPTVSTKGTITSADGPSGTWITGMVFGEGQSGSPVYDGEGRVIGLAKGQMASDGEPVPGLYVVLPIADANGLVALWSRPEACAFVAPAPTPPLPPQALEEQTQQCVIAATTPQVEPWIVTGGARAAGPGISGDVQRDERNVCYSAPPRFQLRGQVAVKNLGNNGGRGSLSDVRYERDTSDRPVRACITATAWSEDGLFRAGGWQNVEISGEIERFFAGAEIADIRQDCASKVSAAHGTHQ